MKAEYVTHTNLSLENSYCFDLANLVSPLQKLHNPPEYSHT
jgi:hypothetical protein